MELKTMKYYQRTVERIKTANEDNKRMAVQLVNIISAQNMTSCNAEIVLSLCRDLIEINSQISPIK